MKKFYRITALLLALLCAAALTAFTEDGTVDLSPKVSPDGKLLTEISSFDFTENTFARTYSGSYVLGHNVLPEGGDLRYRLLTPGGGLAPTLLAYSANGDDLTDADWVCLYLDASQLQNTDSFSLGLSLHLATNATPSQTSTASIAPLSLTAGQSGYYRTLGGEWNKVKITADGQIDVGKDFCGYVAFPLSAFAHTKISNYKYIDGVTAFDGLVGKGYKYLARTYFYLTTADTWESVTPIYLDDLTFFAAGDAHTHAFDKGSAVAPTCAGTGYTLYTCACGESVRRDTVAAAEHAFGTYKADKDGVAYRICSGCGKVETAEDITDAPAGNDDLVTVTFDYGKAGGAAKRKFQKGHALTEADVPYKMTYADRFTYQFSGWATDKAGICPKNPVGTAADTDVTYYARYTVATYADKYDSLTRAISKSDGIYDHKMGQTVAFGNSNMALYNNLETDFAAAGYPAYNTSVAGSTSYEMLEYFKVAVFSYQPKYIVTNVTTNDMAYYNMSEKQIFTNMVTLYETMRELLPDTVMFVSAANPLPGRTEYFPSMERINTRMQEFCDTHENIVFVDWYGKVLDYANNYPTGWDTWTHLNQAGLKYIFDDVLAAIRAYEAEA